MTSVEYWVMRVVVADGARRTLAGAYNTDMKNHAERTRVLEGIVSGRYLVIGDDICEPIEVYDDQADAMERAVHEHATTGCMHKVTLNAEI